MTAIFYDNRLFQKQITIICYLWGDWCGDLGISYVNRLYRGIQRNTSLQHRFICVTDIMSYDFDEGIEKMYLKVPKNWVWNLKKMYMYSSIFNNMGRVFCFDLDVVITGNINSILSQNEGFITCEDACVTYKGMIGGSLIGFDAGFGRELWDHLQDEKQYMEVVRTTRGSERKYYRQMIDMELVKFWQTELPGQVVSFKKQCRKGLPEDACIVRFHGVPRPHERLDDSIVKEHWI